MVNRLADDINRREAETTIITADRGFESYYLFMLLDKLGFKYCVRIKDINGYSISSRYEALCDEDGSIDAVVKKRYTRCITVQNNKEQYKDYIYLPCVSKNPFIPKTKKQERQPWQKGIGYQLL